MALCMAEDVAGLDPFPRGFPWSLIHRGTLLLSRIDRIYTPPLAWTMELPVSIPTNWSDHKMVYADCHLLQPKVELAVPAKRLPKLESLEASKDFWPATMNAWVFLLSGPVTLERWTAFKKGVLDSGCKLVSQQCNGLVLCLMRGFGA